jgi:hypothetical protein
VQIANPFDPQRSRRVAVLRRPRRVRALAPRGRQPVIALLNGRPLLRAGWRRRLRDGDHLAFVALPRGGGRGGSNPLGTLLSLAVMSFAPWAAAGLLGTTVAAVGTTLAGQALTTALGLAGQALVASLFPPPQAARAEQPSPTYTLQAQGNFARLEQPIPVQYGRVLSYPDLAAQPYTEFAGNEQYLYQLLCLGQGEHEIHEIRIEDTPIAAFGEVETQVVPPGGALTLFPAQVVTSVEVSGQEMAPPASGTWSRSGTTVTITQENHRRGVGQAVHLDFGAHALGQGYYRIAGVPSASTFTVTAASGTGSGSVTVQSVLGGLDGFVANPAGTAATHVAFDLVFPRGLYRGVDGDTAPLSVRTIFQVRRVDELGLPVGPWITLHDQTVSARTRTPQRRSFRYALPEPGRYRVRGRRVTDKEGGADDGHDVAWSALRAYLPETRDFGDVTLIALRMRATNNLSVQASRKIAVLASRKLPVWTGTGWTAPQPTRSIAWALADAARHPAYGADLADAQIDLAGLLALDALWSARGDTFDGRFDRSSTWWEAARQIARAGRALPFMQGGRLRAVRDGPETLPVCAFSMRSIVEGSFQVEYVMPGPETADAVRVKYFDGTVWRPHKVDAALPGSMAAKPAPVELFGVTRRRQALAEGMFLAACNRYRRRIVSFATEMEGYIPALGDTIAIQHDMLGWGSHAEAVAWDPATRRLRVTEPPDWSLGPLVVEMRRRDGSVSGPWPVGPTEAPDIVALAVAPDLVPDTGPARERMHLAFRPAAVPPLLAKVRSVVPEDGQRVRIVAIPDDPSVHAAETGRTAPPLVTSQLPRLPRAPAVAQLRARLLPGTPRRAVLSWEPAPGAETYHIDMAEGDDPTAPDLTWTRAADTTATDYVTTLLFDLRTVFRVRGVGLAAGPWAAVGTSSLARLFWAPGAPFWTASHPMWRN